MGYSFWLSMRRNFESAITGGLPWSIGNSRNSPAEINLWVPWSLWTWAALIAGMILLWRQAKAADPSLLLFSSQTLHADPSE
jgi:hypothetical protein